MRKELNITILLSFVSGFVDTSGFVALKGIFTAHVTGNLVLAGAFLFSKESGIVSKLSVLPIFAITIGLVFLLNRYFKKTKKPFLKSLLRIESLFLLLFSFFGFKIHQIYPNLIPEYLLIILASFGVIAMSVQNALMKLSLPKLVPTTIMTGNTTQFVMDLASYATSRNLNEEEISGRKIRMNRFGSALSGFFLGALSGGLLVHYFGLACCIFPAVLIAGLSFFVNDDI